MLRDTDGIYFDGVGWIGQWNSYYWEQERYGVDMFVRDMKFSQSR
jgi:hypothetical protein